MPALFSIFVILIAGKTWEKILFLTSSVTKIIIFFAWAFKQVPGGSFFFYTRFKNSALFLPTCGAALTNTS